MSVKEALLRMLEKDKRTNMNEFDKLIKYSSFLEKRRIKKIYDALVWYQKECNDPKLEKLSWIPIIYQCNSKEVLKTIICYMTEEESK